ncbi:hypothetical protein Tco_0236548 [Tanacetum coccineum]
MKEAIRMEHESIVHPEFQTHRNSADGSRLPLTQDGSKKSKNLSRCFGIRQSGRRRRALTSVLHSNFAPQTSQQQGFQSVDQCKGSPPRVNNIGAHIFGIANQLDCFSFDLPQDFEHNFFTGFNGMGQEDASLNQI